MYDDLDELVRSAVGEVFGTMLNLPVRTDPSGAPAFNGDPTIAACVGFLGRMAGAIYLHTTEHFACRVTTALTGHAPGGSGDALVSDAVGEVTNMVAGCFKARLRSRGLECWLTIPIVVRGQEVAIEGTNQARRRVVALRCEDAPLVAEVIFQENH